LTAYDFEKLRVLLIDDDPYMVRIVSTVLEAMGVRDILGIDGRYDALEAIRTWGPNLVIVDHLMEPLPGLELIRKVRQCDTEHRYIPLVLLTGYANAEVVTRARFQAGADAVLVKPVSAKRLYDCIVSIRESERPFIRTNQYFGPDRRLKDRPFEGPERRGDRARRADAQGPDQPPAAPEPQAGSEPANEVFEIDVPEDEDPTAEVLRRFGGPI
jgi:CheY-like chemotaxis protein